jgi:hypothetical protein
MVLNWNTPIVPRRQYWFASTFLRLASALAQQHAKYFSFLNALSLKPGWNGPHTTNTALSGLVHWSRWHVKAASLDH